jgi:DNA-binding NtrC family response regulator
MEVYTAITRRVLVVCSDAAESQVIEDATRAWMFETVVCSSLRESQELLAGKEFALVFCRETLEDGTYSDLLSLVKGTHGVPVVVMISDVEEDQLFREAMALGAFGVVPHPCSTKDVQWMVIRATRGATRSPKSALSSENAALPGSSGLPSRPE